MYTKELEILEPNFFVSTDAARGCSDTKGFWSVASQIKCGSSLSSLCQCPLNFLKNLSNVCVCVCVCVCVRACTCVHACVCVTFLIRSVGHNQVKDLGIKVLVFCSQDALQHAGAHVYILILIFMNSLQAAESVKCTH